MFADVVSTAIVIVLALLPGAGIGARLLRGRGGDLWTWAVTSAVSSIALVGVPYLAAHVTHVSLDIAMFTWIGLAVAATWAFRKDLRSVLRLRTDVRSSIAIVLPSVAALVGGPWLILNTDTFYHLAAVRSLLQTGSLIVTDPFYGSAATAADPSSGLLHAFMAILCRVKGADPLFLLAGANVLGAFLVVGGMLLLARTITRGAKGAHWVVWAYVLLVLFADFRSMGYPSRVSLGVGLVGLAALLDFLRERDRTSLAVIAVSSFAVVAHLGSTQAYLVSAVALASGFVLCDRSSTASMRTKTALVALLVLVVATVPLLVPRVSALTSQTELVTTSVDLDDPVSEAPAIAGAVDVPGGTILDPDVYFESGRIVFIGALVLALIVLVIALKEHDGLMGAASATVLAMGVLALTPPLTAEILARAPYVLRRLLLGLRFGAVLPIGAVIAYQGDGRRRTLLRAAAAIWVAAALVAAMPFIRTVYWKTPSTSVHRIGQANESIWRTRDTSVIGLIGEVTLDGLRTEVGEDYPVVAATEEVGYALAGLLPVRIVAAGAGHSPVAVEVSEGPLRREDMAIFFTAEATADQRRAIAERWEVDYAVVWITSDVDELVADSIDAQAELFEPVLAVSRIRLWRVAVAGD